MRLKTHINQTAIALILLLVNNSASAATRIASYSFDEPDWTVSASIFDSIGGHHGNVSGVIKRNSSDTPTAHPNTCASATFRSGAIDITGLPVSTTPGDKTSISFWMYWDGVNSIMPLGWQVHDLWIVSGNFGFNTGGGDIYGLSSDGLANSWHHIVAEFTNNNITDNKLYIDGIEQILTHRQGTIVNSRAVVDSHLRLGGWWVNNGYRFSGYIDEVNVYNGALTQSEINNDLNYIHAGACPADPAPPAPQPEQLIASYNFNEDWSSTTPLLDLVGAANGNISGSVSKVLSPAAGNKPETCAAGQFTGGAIDITGLPVSTAPGDKTSISFWMYWDGSNSVMPLGWRLHDLWFVSDDFGFNTSGGDIYGISSSGLANSWHHVAAVFTNNSVFENKIYIDGIEQTLTHRRGTIINSRAINNSHLRLGGWWANNGYRFQGLLDEIKIYTGEISQATINANMNEVHNCPNNGGGGGDTAANKFNCVENGSNGISGKLYTKTAAQTFSFDIVALRNESTIETSFSDGTDHSVTVELVDASSGNCSTYSSLNPSVSQSLIFAASDSGTKTSALMSPTTAYRKVKCRMTDNTNTPVIVDCSTDSFAIRPTNFNITSNMTNSGFTGPPKTKTDENFTLTATAISGYNGIPEINNGKLEAHSGAVLTGNISGSFGLADSITGTATGTAFTYNEVGSLRFTAQGIYDDTFTAVDQGSDCTNDFSNTLVGDKVGCKFGNTSASNFFGRFIPDHIDVALNTPVFSAGCGSFTYIGQPVKYTIQPIVSIAAKNSSGATTQNYTGDFWKIDPTDNTYVPTYTEASHTLFSINDNPSVTDNGDGTGTLSFADTTSNILSIDRNAPEAEFDAEIAMSFNLSDTDGIAVANVNGSPQSNPISFGATSTGNGISFSSNKTQRWGRVVLNNAHGSELSVLPVPLQTEYFNGSNFILNSDDNCTPITLNSQLLLSNPNTSSGASQPGNTAMTIGSGTSSATLDNNPLSVGSTNINFSAPGSGNTGYIDINSDFSILPWLLFDWDNDSNHDNSPSGKATFGIFKGNSKQIYFREVY